MEHIHTIQKIEEIWYNRQRTKRARKWQRALKALERRTAQAKK